jgi:CDP-diacylglycerol--serine O-phosphatidyltransferase
MSQLTLVGIVIALVLLALLRTRFFALFFVLYISATLLLNIAWRGGWTGVAPPRVYDGE